MRIDSIIEQLTKKQSEFRSVLYGFIEVKKNSLDDIVLFTSESLLDKFSNSLPEESEQIVFKSFNNVKTFFLSMKDYEAIINYEGNKLKISKFWRKQEFQLPIQDHKINFKKAKQEMISHFSTSKKMKLSS